MAAKDILFLLVCLFHVDRLLCSYSFSALRGVTSTVTNGNLSFFAIESSIFSESTCIYLFRICYITVMIVAVSTISPLLSFPLFFISYSPLRTFQRLVFCSLLFQVPLMSPLNHLWEMVNCILVCIAHKQLQHEVRGRTGMDSF